MWNDFNLELNILVVGIYHRSILIFLFGVLLFHIVFYDLYSNISVWCNFFLYETLFMLLLIL